MIRHFPYAQLGHADHGWLNARHHFSFASYYNPDRMSFGVLRVINDDLIAAGQGFGTHPHRDMEIITYVRRGAITHRDSQGNSGVTQAGDVQVMSAGSGVAHSEYNREPVETNIYQIWIEPNQRGVTPRWKAREFPKTPVRDALIPLVSGRAPDVEHGAVFIHQDAAIYGGRLAKGTALSHPITYQAYVLASEGELIVAGQRMAKGDGLEVTDIHNLPIEAVTDAEILVIDVPSATKH